MEISLSPRAALLYPGDDVPLLTELPDDQRPDQLVVLDGTWHHTKTLMRELPRLATLPRFRLAPQSPGRYRIRREPDDVSLSTLEAVAQALADNEPSTPGLDQQLIGLMAAFDNMVNRQLACPKSNWRKNSRRTRGAPNVPRAILGDPQNIVVAYGEQEQSDYRSAQLRRPELPPVPVYWIAKRLESNEVFETAIEHECLHDEYFASRLRLGASQVESAISLPEFRRRWQSFLKPSDVIVVNSPGTEKMIRQSELCENRCLVLKSINVRSETTAIDEEPVNGTRAAERLAGAIATTKRLRQPQTEYRDGLNPPFT